LDEIGVDPMNGVLLRLDEHLGEADHLAVGTPATDHRSVVTRLDLEDLDLQTGAIAAYPVDLPIREIGALELQLRSLQRQRLEIELRSQFGSEAVTLDLHAVGDGTLRTYCLELAEAIASWRGDRLTGVRFRAPDRGDGSGIEIHSVAFLSPTAAFAGRAYGLTHRRQERETRQSIFQWSSSVLRFPLQLQPTDEAELELGVAALLADRPVRVEVALVSSEEKRRLWTTTIGAGPGWTDRQPPLGSAENGEVLLELRVVSDDPNVVFWSNPTVVGPVERRFNVIMVLEDALRADHLSCYGYHRETTPVKDVFAQRGVRFARCYAQATKTRFSCPSFMTSLLPTATGVEGIWHPHPSLHPDYITLAEVLRRRGFVTASIHQNPNAGTPAGLHQGFSFLFESVPGRAEDLYTGLPQRFIEEYRERNFFLYLHLADPHEPYDPPQGFRGWFREIEGKYDRRDPRWMLESRRALYDGEITANDHWFASFLEHLERLGVADDTLVVFMSDHGEHLGEHDLWSHNPPGYSQVLRTPLIMVYPRRLPGGVVSEEIVQNLDIMPTILELAGADNEALLMQGESLLPLILETATPAWNRDLAYSEEALFKKSRSDPRPYGSVFSGRWHVLDSLFAPMKLFDVVSDPMEESPLRAARELRNRMPNFLRDMQLAELEIWRGITGGEEATVTLDPEAISKLRALGYLE
jgi:arylsulfatase